MEISKECSIPYRRENAERYLLGGMSKQEKEKFAKHIEQCTECNASMLEVKQILGKLKAAAADEGWDDKRIEQLAEIYGRDAVRKGINWRLAFRISVIIIVLGVIPLFWWANTTETRMANLVSINREVEPDSTVLNAFAQPILDLHRSGEDEAAIDLLNAAAADTNHFHMLYAERLLGLSNLFLGSPELALQHLDRALATKDATIEERIHWYRANAFLMMGNKNAARIAIKKVISMKKKYDVRASEILDALDNF